MRLAAVAVVACTLAGPLPVAPPAEANELPRVRLVATGGTIANRPGARLTAGELVALVPDLDRWVRVEAEQFANVPSGALTLRQWIDLSRRLNQLFADDAGLAGIVVTAGTDTLEELAYFLHLTSRSERPVVVTGAMRGPPAVGFDGAANLLQAFRVAGDPASRGRGALVVLNDEINSAREVTKTDAQRLHAFQSNRYGILGVVDSDRVVYYRDTSRRHTSRSEFDVSAIGALPRVDVILVYQDARADLIRSAVDLGARGLIVAGAGAGSVSGDQRDGLRYAREQGVIVVTGTRSEDGRVTSREATDTSAGRIGTEDLAPLKARILLMLALTRTSDPDEIARMFREY